MKVLNDELNRKAKQFQRWLRDYAAELDEYIDQESDGRSDAPQIALTMGQLANEIDVHFNGPGEDHDTEFCSVCFHDSLEVD